ncbi:MAG: LuxR C-terminal-related transcriptional regulator [Anaerolineae bacterium]|nr:LuxR C-terminal-related transcriptional regulator [Candidatus Roseilinea sp.]MDW8449886.1 LuxR C-terminal-related transcriptional regulator [Anaerolineae bacterium]
MAEQHLGSALLHTRIHRPKTCSDVVVRTRLFDRLSANLDNPLTLISAPAGFGKTTLVTSWLDRVLAKTDGDAGTGAFRTAWLSVNSLDNDPHMFFSALTTAIESAFPGACADVQAALRSGQPVALSWFTAALTQACISLPERLVLIVDDYYLITNDAVHAEMATLIRNWSTRVHTIILTRAHPPLRLAQLRARQQLLEIRASDLQFDRNELASFVTAHVRADLPASLLDVLLARTEGWAVGVRLATFSLQQRSDVATFIGEFERNSNRYIMDYLVDEVLGDQPEEIQTFLLHTAALPKLTSPLCAAVVEGMDAPTCQMMLEQLERRNLFIVNLDDHRGWYRYHHQFQAFLLNRLRARVGEDGLTALRLRAADWLASNGYLDEAIVEYVSMGEPDRAVDLIEDNLVALQNDEQWLRLWRWLSYIPEATLHQRPGLLIALGWIKRFQSADEQIAGLTERIERLLRAGDEAQRARWQAQLLGLKLAANVISNVEEAIAIARQARQLAPRDHIWVRTYAALQEILRSQELGGFDHAVRVLESLLQDAEFSDGKSLARLHFVGATVHMYAGALPEAHWHARRCRDHAVQCHMPLTAAWGSCAMGMADFHRNELQSAEAHFQSVIEDRFVANWQATALSAYFLLSMWVEQGRINDAQWVVDVVREWERAMDNSVETRISDALTAYLDLHRGNLKPALHWARSSTADMPGKVRLNDPELYVLIHVLLAQNTAASLARAESALAALLAQSKRANERRVHHDALVWLALLKRAQNRQSEALDALAEAVAFCQPRDLVRRFIEGGEPVREMLTQLLRANRCTAEATALLAEIARAGRPPAPVAVSAAPDAAIEPLTTREFEVLELLAAKLSNKEIAAKLNILPITVRNHATQIYAKLHVASRRQAVEQARAHGLIR